MRARFIILALLVAAVVGVSATSSAASTVSGSEVLPSLTVFDFNGLYLTRDYRDCDAVGTVIVRGNYDYIERDGQLEIFLGYDGGPNPKANAIYVSVSTAPWCNPLRPFLEPRGDEQCRAKPSYY